MKTMGYIFHRNGLPSRLVQFDSGSRRKKT